MTKKTDKSVTPIALGFEDAAAATGLSKSFLRNAVKDPNPSRRLRTVRVNRRRLIREEDLRAWFETVARNDESQRA
jgi:excisionase family DNA binding protein